MRKETSTKNLSTGKKKPKKSPSITLKIRNAMHEVTTSGVSVHVISHKDRWAVKRSGTSRASKVYDRKTHAITRARSLAKKTSGTLVIHGKDGRIEKRETAVKKSKK